MDLVVWIEMNKIIFSVVILVSVLGSTAFVAPVLAEEKKQITGTNNSNYYRRNRCCFE